MAWTESSDLFKAHRTMIIKVVTIWAFKAGVHINGVYSDPLQQHRFWKFLKEEPFTLATYITLISWSRGA